MANGYYQKIEERLQNRTREWYQDPSETEENKIRIYGWKQHKNLSEDGKEKPFTNKNWLMFFGCARIFSDIYKSIS